MRHTPGPWEAVGLTERFDLFTVMHTVGDIRGFIASVHMKMTADERVANAHLIAAAPDLLAALKALTAPTDEFPERCCCEMATGFGDRHADFCLEARAAIAKAEGSPVHV